MLVIHGVIPVHCILIKEEKYTETLQPWKRSNMSFGEKVSPAIPSHLVWYQTSA